MRLTQSAIGLHVSFMVINQIDYIIQIMRLALSAM